LYSSKDNDAVLDGFYQKLMDNRVVLKYEPDQPLLAVFARSGDDTVITINAYYQNFGPYDRDVMLTAILAAAAAYENPPVEEENVKALFFDTIEAYLESEYPMEDIAESSWYAEQTLLVGENSGHLPA
jgi:hypothetical protein